VQRILGLDLGSRNIGIALSDPLGITAQGFRVLRRSEMGKDLAELAEIVCTHDVKAIVVGLPKNMNNSLGYQAEETIAFVEEMRSILPCEIVLWDERLTTKAAEMHLRDSGVKGPRRRGIVDMVAAVMILQGYLDMLSAGNR